MTRSSIFIPAGFEDQVRKSIVYIDELSPQLPIPAGASDEPENDWRGTTPTP